MNKIKLVSDIYGVLLELKIIYDETETDLTFQEYAQKNITQLINKGIEWLADDELEGLDLDD